MLVLALLLLALLVPGTAAASTARYGEATVELRTEDGKRQLVFTRRPGAAPKVLDVAVPARDQALSREWTDALALGLDRSGRLTVVLPSRRGLLWTRVTRPQLRRVPGTSRRDSFPSLFRGRVAYSRQDGLRSVVRLGGLDRPASTLWRNTGDPGWVARDTAVGAGGAVGFVIVSDGAEEGLFDARLARRGHSTLDLWPGDVHNGGLTLTVSTNGRRLKVDGLTYALPSGRRQ